MFSLEEQVDTGDWYHSFEDDSLYLCPAIKELMGVEGDIKARDLLRKMKVIKGHRILSCLKDLSSLTGNYLEEELEFVYEGKVYNSFGWFRIDVVNGRSIGCYGNVELLKAPVDLVGHAEAATGSP